MTAKLPPLILLGIDTPIGLALLRELGGHGIEVHGIARSGRALGLYSRHLHRGYLRPQGERALVALIERIGRESGAPFLMTVAMADALAMRDAADAGRLTGVRPLLPPRDKLDLVNDKAAVCALAERLGIPVPATWQPRPDDLAPPAGVDFPCILKWRDPEAVAEPLARAGLPLHKAEYVYDAAGLAAALGRTRALGLFPMVQSFCPGTGLGQMFLMKGGQALMRFQHERLHEWPPEGGISTLCRSLPPDPHPALMARSEALLREIGWEGPAMVEYRHDAATGRTALMEINGRFWGSQPLATAAGAHFGLGTYYALGLGRPLPDMPPCRAGLRSRFLVPETRRLARILFAPAAIPDRSRRFSRSAAALAWLRGFADGTRHYVFAWSDPRPFLADAAFMLREAVRSLAGRLRGRPPAAKRDVALGGAAR